METQVLLAVGAHLSGHLTAVVDQFKMSLFVAFLLITKQFQILVIKNMKTFRDSYYIPEIVTESGSPEEHK